jgi:hypothetical protein
MAGGFVEIRGLSDVRRVLNTVAPREAKALMRGTVKSIADEAVEDAKGYMLTSGLYDSGDLVSGTKARTERDEGLTMKATVRVSGAYYWRFLELGDGPDGIEHAMFLKARESTLQNLDRYIVEGFSTKLIDRIKRAMGR